MANEELEPVVEASEPAVETTPDATPTPAESEIDVNKPVYNSDDARKVLEATKKGTSKGKSAPTKPNSGPNTPPDYQKQYEEIQKLVGRQSKELGELRKFQQQNAPVIESYRKFLAQQEQAQLAAQYGQDPMAVIREMAKREAMQAVAPYQEQMVQAEASNIHNWIRENSGGEYEALAPVMADILEEFQAMDAAQGTNKATELAKNPNLLMQLAAGQVHLNAKAQTANQLQQVQQKKAQNLKIANGVAKSNNNQAATPTEFKNQSLADMTAQLRQMGIVK